MTAPAGTSLGDITQAELRLAARNHALPLEALRHDITPAGLHYLLVHYDIPAIDGESWRLHIGGAVRAPLSLTLAELQAPTARSSLSSPASIAASRAGSSRSTSAACRSPRRLHPTRCSHTE
jgi:hypothetical protein